MEQQRVSPRVSLTLCNLPGPLINWCDALSCDPADINRPDGVRVGMSDPLYQCQAVSADNSREEAAAAAEHLDIGAAAQRSALQCEEKKAC